MKNIIFRSYMAIIVVMFLLTSCVSQKKTRLIQEKTIEDVSAGFINNRQTSYHLQPGDQLYINVFSVDPKNSQIVSNRLSKSYD
ncbi:MAG: hypothetical protein PF487_11255 [Bacteroidales bacterium]|jgi:hypothetical protein|nr:hypothetical protein [Bacteroidales bacterium]